MGDILPSKLVGVVFILACAALGAASDRHKMPFRWYEWPTLKLAGIEG